MKLREIRISNFMPYFGEQSILFDAPSSTNVFVVVGDNMRGKTSFLNAIRWCMYGEAFGRNRRVIHRHDLVNSEAARAGDWSCAVSLEFEHNDSRYQIRRSIEKEGHVNSPTADDDFKEVRSLVKDGVAMRADLVDDEIGRILPKEISRFFLFDGELLQEYEVLLDPNNSQGRALKEEIEKVLGVPALLNGRSVLKSLYSDASAKLTKQLRTEAQSGKLAEEKSKHEVRREQIQEAVAELDLDIISLNSSIADLDEVLKNAEGALTNKARLDALLANIDEAKREIARYKQLKAEVTGSIWRDVFGAVVERKLKEIDTRVAMHMASVRERGAAQKRLADIDALVESGACPVCESEVAGEVRNRLDGQRQSLQNELETAEQNVGDFEKASEEQRFFRVFLKKAKGSEYLAAVQEVDRRVIALYDLERKRDEIRKDIEGKDTETLAAKRAEQMKKEHALAAAQHAKNSQLKDLEEVEKKIKQVDGILVRGAGVEPKTKREVEVYDAVAAIFDGSIESLREALRSEVEKCASSAFRGMTTEGTYKGLRINNQYGLDILGPDGNKIRERSAGAEQVVALSLIDGLNKTAGKRGPIVMDTPFGRLDPRHRKNIVAFLPEMSDQVVLLVHEGEFNLDADLAPINDRVAKVFKIERITATHSNIVPLGG